MTNVAKRMRAPAYTLLVMCSVASLTEASPDLDKRNEISDIIFESCLNYVDNNIVPFENFNLFPLTEGGRKSLGYIPGENISSFHIKSDRYIAMWGELKGVKLCMIRLNGKSTEDPYFLVRSEGFLEYISHAAEGKGLSVRSGTSDFSIVDVLDMPTWERIDSSTNEITIANVVNWGSYDGLFEVGQFGLTRQQHKKN